MEEGRAAPGTLGRRLLAAARAIAPHAAVAAAAVVAYANTFDVPFVFDDLASIVDRAAVHLVDLDVAALVRAAEGFPLHRWLAYLTFALNHLAGGLDPAGYHAVNLAIHAGAASIVLALSREILARLGLDAPAARRVAMLAALLFAVHPVQTQAVTYVVQRMASLGAFFALLALWLWLRSRRASARARAPLVVAAAAAALLAVSCKESFVAIPLVALVLEASLFPGWRERLRAPRALAALGAAAAAAGGAALAYAEVIAREHERFGIPLLQRLLSQGRILCHYLSLLAWPLPSRLHVDYANAPSTGLLSPPSTLAGLLGLAILVAAAVAVRRRLRLAPLAAGWFLAALSIEQSVLPLDLAFEQRLYFASVGFLLLAAFALDRLGSSLAVLAAARLPARAARGARIAPLLALAPGAGVVIALAAGTFVRNDMWRDPIRLFAATESWTPGAPRSLLSLGVAYAERGRWQEAERVYRRVLELDPANAPARLNLGNVALAEGDVAGAERWYRGAIVTEPGLKEAWYALGSMHMRRGEWTQARDMLARAVELAPAFVSARVNLGVTLGAMGDPDAALVHFDEALRLDAAAANAYWHRARIALARGLLQPALADAERYAALVRGAPDGEVLLGDCLARAGRLGEARAAYRRALSRDPGNADALAALRRMGVTGPSP